MRVASDGWISPDLDAGLVGADAGERQRDGDVDVGGEALNGFARGAFEDAQRLRQAIDGNAARDQQRRTLEAGRRLAGDDFCGVDFALCYGADGVEAEQGASRNHDARAGLAGAVNQIHVADQLADRERHEDAATGDGGFGNGAEVGCGNALDDDVGVFRQRGQRDDARLVLETLEIARGFGFIAGGYGRERQARDVASVDGAGDFQADGAKAGDRNGVAEHGMRWLSTGLAVFDGTALPLIPSGLLLD